MNEARTAVFGAGGYTGMMLARLLARHPHGVTLTVLASERLAREGVGGLDLPGGVGGAAGGGWICCGEDEGVAACARLGVDVALLCTPVEASLHLVPALLRAGVRVLDLSGAFRLRDPLAFARAYGLEHSAPAALAEATYALPEVTGTKGLAAAPLVSNPGCYVTAAALVLAPLWRRGLLAPDAPLFVDGKSGASGAGRKGAVELSLCELEGDLRPYRIGRHQHAPEIRQVLASVRPASGPLPRLVFVPHLCDTRRGLLVTCHASLAAGATAADAQAALLHDYAYAARVHVVPAEEVTLRRPVGTPDAFVGVAAGDEPGTLCAVASLDNLLKGAASQAVQNLNAMLGLPDGAGLDALWSPAA